MKTAAFYFQSRILTQVKAEDEKEAWDKAVDENNITIAVNRPHETPLEFKAKLCLAKIIWY
jgi:hypothetical protein